MALQDYHKKRDFEKTREPKGTINHEGGHLFIIQKHAASHLHYDFRLELDGVLLSWAVPKGPCLDPSVKRLAIHVDDHPVEYGSFEGIIPKNQYGGGTVMLWDKGLWRSLDSDPARAYQKGHLRFELEAEKLQGRWDLIRFKDKNWFLIKYSDAFAKKQSDYDITTALPNSVVSNQSLDDISAHYQHIWNTKKAIMLPKTLSKGPFPNTIKPMLASLIHQAPEGDNWLHEVKFDGYRILAFINTKIHLKSRTNNDWTSNFTSLVTALSRFPSTPVIFDGEVTLLNEQGISDFQLLQNTIEADAQAPYVYYIFDILYYDKYDLTSLPLLQRKALLKSLLPDHDPVLRYSDHIIDHGEEVFDRACKLGLEGIISKNIDSKYIMSRSKQWLKIKNIKRQEFVIGGYSQPKGSRDHFGALYLGLFNDQGDFVYVGDVGTGFTQASLKTLFSQLQKIRLNHSPFSEKIANSSKATWVKPLLIAEVEFTEWTQAGHIRHPSFKGLRLDKKPQDVIHEKELAMNQPNKPATKKKIFSITHPEKIVYPEDGITKQDLLEYYDSISDNILPFIKNRALSLVRCPENFKHCFFQRHFTASTPKALKSIAIESHEKTADYIYLDNKEGLLSLVQMGILEIHPWGSLINNIENPDFIVFDLDPAPDVDWSIMVMAAREIKTYLEQYQLISFIKTTGGKGLHIVIPIQPEYSWDAVKNFTHVFVEFLEKTNPQRYISIMAKNKRQGKIFVDYLRNQRSATAIAPYSTRARIHAPVSVPIHWDELSPDRRDIDFTIKNVVSRLDNLKTDPWQDFRKIKQSLGLDKLK